MKEKVEGFQNPVFAGLTTCQKRSLTQSNLIDLEQFLTMTKEEVLGLPRIGEKAIRRLEENGVTFKENGK